MADSAVPSFDHPRFTIIRQIGAGGMGMVFEAHDKERDVRVALKLLPAAKPQALVRFKNEFRSIAEIVHPNLVPLYELISDGKHWFFTMELIDGVDLLSSLNRAAAPPEAPNDFDQIPTYVPDSNRMTEEFGVGASSSAFIPRNVPVTDPMTVDAEHQLRTLFERLGKGVAFLHSAGVVHRDLKPSNVLVRHNGEPVILDFGLAASLQDDELRDEISGTLLYMAPEQLRGNMPTPAVDWYAVGVMLYEALTGAVPFRGEFADVIEWKLSRNPLPPAALRPAIPPDLNQLCIELLAQDPEARPSGPEVIERISGRTAVATAGQPERASSELALVGRERLLAQLHGLLHRVAEGVDVAVHLHGHSGMGKSVLLAAFLEDASKQRDVVVLAARCFEQESMPFKALDGLIDRLARYLHNLPSNEVEALMPSDIAALGLMFPALLNIPTFASAPQDVLAIPERRELRQRAFATLRALLKRL